MEIKVQRLSKYGRVPTKINDSDAGWDIYASEDAIIDPSQSQLVSTDMAMAIPEGYVGLIWIGLEWLQKEGFTVLPGLLTAVIAEKLKFVYGTHQKNTVL